jgi:hypothetical protein
VARSDESVAQVVPSRDVARLWSRFDCVPRPRSEGMETSPASLDAPPGSKAPDGARGWDLRAK